MMNYMKSISQTAKLLAITGLFVAGLAGCLIVNAQESESGRSGNAKNERFFRLDSKGNLIRPDGYRRWVYVGTPTTPDDMNNGKAPFPEFHNVYIDPVSYDYWKEHGEWREGTILIKELVSVGSKAAVSGKGYFMGEFIGLEATIKSKEHFPDEPGNWAYFSFTNPGQPELHATATAFKTETCNTCHDASARDDFVFTQYYPILRAAKGFGKGRPESTGKVKASGEMSSQSDTPSTPVQGKWQPTAPTPAGGHGGVPLGKAALFAWLKSGAYRDYKHQESKRHPSQGPHTSIDLPVRVFMNDTVVASLKAGSAEHGVGSSIVKEMYSQAGELAGWAVMVKTQPQTEGGKGWFWYEVTSTSNPDDIAAMGNGVPGCFTCHSHGDDMVLTQFPLR